MARYKNNMVRTSTRKSNETSSSSAYLSIRCLSFCFFAFIILYSVFNVVQIGLLQSSAAASQHQEEQMNVPAVSSERISASSVAASKWRLWTEMTPSEQDVALEKAFARAKPYGKMLGRDVSKFHNHCKDGNKPLLLGKGGEHMVCGPKPDVATGCKFFSFGIRDDPSWDIHMGETWNCRGFAGDPSIVHPSKLHPAVTFHNVGLKMLRTNFEQQQNPEDEWILTSLPQLRQFLDWDYVDIVKIDCEGCEVAMARDILAEDTSFLDKIGQISIETHATRTWVNTTEELYYYALMFPLLEDAGFKLIWSSVFGCGRHEHDGCRPEMEGKMSMPCGSRPRSEKNVVPIGWSCHDWLWSRVE
jgi:hypothetical protein